MKRRQLAIRDIVICAIIVSVGVLAGCAGKKAMWKTDEGVLLQYRMPEGEALKYEKVEDSTQNMKMMGQSMDTSTQKTVAFTMEPKGLEEGKLDLTVTIDAMDAGLKTPQGEFSADPEPILGKSFDMEISIRGKESDLSGADGIEYNLGMAGTRSIRPDFEAIFPDLPEGRVKIWDTWPSQDTINVKDSGMDVQIVSESLNVLEGFETVDGRECAKVTAEVDGTVTGAGMQGGANLSFEGTMTGKEVWYFDYVNGVFVKSSSDLSMVATVSVTGPQEMTIPVTQTMNITVELVD
jgi:hypothetical protein